MSSITDVYSPRTTFRCTRLRGAKVGGSVCQFCAVGCSQLGFLKDGKLFNEIFKGEKSRKEFFNEILDILTLLGGELGNVR